MACTSSPVVDPLIEQMISTLHLAKQGESSTQGNRRFSDADRLLSSELSPPTSSHFASTSATPDSRNDTAPFLDVDRRQPVPQEVSHTTSYRRVEPLVATAPSPVTVEPHFCDRAVCAASEAFETTELLELVLGFLDSQSVFTARLVCASWNDTICVSPELRLHLFIARQWMRPGGDFRLLPLTLPDLDIKLGQTIHLGQWISVHMTLDAAKRISPLPARRVRSRSVFEGLQGGLGHNRSQDDNQWPRPPPLAVETALLRLEDLVITQPPILGMQAFLLPPQSPDSPPTPNRSQSSQSLPFVFGGDTARIHGPPACAKLSCDAGITLGFLAETTQSLLKGESDGISVIYKAIVSFCSSDSALRKRATSRTVTKIG